MRWKTLFDMGTIVIETTWPCFYPLPPGVDYFGHFTRYLPFVTHVTKRGLSTTNPLPLFFYKELLNDPYLALYS